VKIFLVLLLTMVNFLVCLSLAAHPTQEIRKAEPPVDNIKLCAVYPHLKDSYWFSINFGMTEQAKQRSITLKVLEAGGYQNTDEQLKQIDQCIQWQASAILVGAVNFEQLSQKLTQVNEHIPTFALANEISTSYITGRTGVSWYQMGYKLGEYLAKKHPKSASDDKIKLAWFPGPKSGGGSLQSTKGFTASLAQSNIEIITIQYGLNDKITQFSLLKNTLKKYKNIDYLAGNAIMAEMAITEVALLPKIQQPKIVSLYLSHGVYRGIKRKKILMANSDQMVLQGKMAINQAVDYLQTGKIKASQTPEIIVVDQANINELSTELSLSPSHFKPIYNVHSLNAL